MSNRNQSTPTQVHDRDQSTPTRVHDRDQSTATQIPVRDWMTPDPVVVASDTPVAEATRLMRQGEFRRLPVVDRGLLVGIVTDRDLKDAAPSQATTLSVYEIAALLDQLTVGKIMTSPVFTVAPDDPIEVAALMMEERKISGLPVVADGELIGILSIGDLLGAFVDLLELRRGERPLAAQLTRG